MNRVSISVDVPDITEGVHFCTSAFGFSKSSQPMPGVVVLRAGSVKVCLLERRAGSKPSAHTGETRRYERHWTPVHRDIQVANLNNALASALVFESSEHGAAAFCSDPFGHGFGLFETARQVHSPGERRTSQVASGAPRARKASACAAYSGRPRPPVARVQGPWRPVWRFVARWRQLAAVGDVGVLYRIPLIPPEGLPRCLECRRNFPVARVLLLTGAS
jgi:hypothetical protein